MICNGEGVNEFPKLPAQDYRLLTYIEIRNSLMTSLPTITDQDFPKMNLVTILDNRYLHCSYVEQWAYVLPPNHIDTDCILYYTTFLSEATQDPTSTPNPIYPESTENTLQWNDTGSSVESTSPWNNITTAKPNDEKQNLVIIILGVLSTLMGLMLILCICVFVKKRKMAIYTRSSGHNSSMANLYTNDFFDMDMTCNISEV